MRTDFQQLYGGDEARYHADLKAHALTETDVEQQVALTLLEGGIDTKLKRQVRVTPEDVLDYYKTHKPVYETAAATRQVDYVLERSKSAEGKCKPTCYFIIRPTANLIRGGTEKSFASVRAHIKSQLLSDLRLRHVQTVIARLEKKEQKLTRYAAGYAPLRTTTPSTGVPDTNETTAPTS
jgi:hypothetical protein